MSFFSLFCFVCLVKTKKVLLHVKPFSVTYLNKLKTPTFKPNILKKMNLLTLKSVFTEGLVQEII